ncbi:hypothetical protein GLOTRDRAFT_99826 [Gloeophyllum trabeum ATCC 11539]|uniref:Uncharacterized protein n=1 Tax=Gloeophyllum trabeum (strain ATCC 11539 / FP-39264 / Madison 617) TaxID=670483 RepID=S7Q6F0_GLOTA|nr:uncharacterized protein GLOTRDRAFT_99826 [Gloeophyllum trabeum ATCC 11539]EPQ55641.1 hypothetical protein GLOTRDRAFT_99826 [Gloeophyllum trabeum ATCC 11539]
MIRINAASVHHVLEASAPRRAAIPSEFKSTAGREGAEHSRMLTGTPDSVVE